MATPIKKVKIGQRFNRLRFVIESASRYQSNGNRKRYGIFLCDCGNAKEILIHSVTSGVQVSCGCMAIEKLIASNKKRTIHGLTTHDLYKRWQKIKDRCYNPNCKRYKDYGGRGIKMFSVWVGSFINFYKWAIANGYSPNLEIDRKNNNKGYSPSNCRFATGKQNSNNTRRNVIVDVKGTKMTLMEACELYGIREKYRSIWQNVKSGKSFLESLKIYNV